MPIVKTKALRTLPEDLTPLPTRLRDHPPMLPLDHNDVRSALWHAAGNLSLAAAILKTTSARLGYLVRNTPSLKQERANAAEMLLDRAECQLITALEDPANENRRDDVAKWILTNGGLQRGWSRPGTPHPAGVGLTFDGSQKSGQIAIKWQTE